MTFKEFRELIEKVKPQATGVPSLTNPHFLTKRQVWERLMRQLKVKAHEEGYPADTDIVNEMYVKTLTKEFTL